MAQGVTRRYKGIDGYVTSVQTYKEFYTAPEIGFHISKLDHPHELVVLGCVHSVLRFYDSRMFTAIEFIPTYEDIASG